MLTLQVLILAGHTWKLIQGYIKITPYLISILELIMRIDENWDPSDEQFLWVLLYCYYLQYRNYNSVIYLKYDSDKFKLKTYLEDNLKYYESMNKIVRTLISFLESLYIWLIFILIFLTITLFEIQCFFAVKLFFFFLIVYKYLQFSYSKKITNTILIYIRIFVIYCGLVTMIIYFYQFTGLTIISKWYESFIKNFQNHTYFNSKNFIGIKLFEKSELTLKLFPHYFSNFLSVLLLNEMTRILNLSQNDEYLLSSFYLEKSINKKIEVFQKDMEEYFDCDLNTKEINILKGKEIYYNETKYKYSKNKYYLFKVLFFFANIYWWVLLIILCSIVTTYQLSAIMLLYIFIISVSFIMIFNKFYNYLQKKSSLFYITKLIRFYQLEHKVLRKIILSYKATTYKLLVIVSLFSIFCIYFNGIIDKVNDLIPYPMTYTAITYICGTYYNSQSNFFTSIWGHLLILVLLIVERYVSRFSFFLELEVLKTERFKSIVNSFKNKAKAKETNPEISKLSDKMMSQFFPPKQTDVGLINEENKVPFEPNCEILMKTFAGDALIDKEELPETDSKIRNSEPKSKRTFNERFSTMNRERLFYERIESKVGVPPCKLFRKFLLVFYNRKFHPNQKETKNSNLSLDLQMSIKYISEELIVFMVFCCAVFKMNIFSVLYLLIVLILQIKGKNLRNISILQIILTIFIIIQYSLFVVNLNSNSDPSNFNDNIRDKLNLIFIPLFNHLGMNNYRYLFYLSAGNTYNQVLSLWTDFITLMFCCLYLENFSYSVFDSEKKPKFNINIVQEKGSVREALSKIDSLEYNEFKESLEYNFGIILKDLQDIRKEIKSFSFYNKFKIPYIEKKGIKENVKQCKTNRNSRLSDQQANSLFFNNVEKKSRIMRIVHYLKKSVYLTMHNIMLVMILILSLFNDCLISLIYITFALYYIYMARGLFLAQKWNLPKAIINFLRPFMLVDISIQILYQNPLNIYLIANYQTLVSFLKYLGISTLINYDNIIDTNYNQEKSQGSILLILKIISYVLVSLQIIIYGSKDFKSFYITFLFKKKESTYRSSMMYTFLFNNNRIKIMNSSMNYRNQIDEVQDNLEKQLEQWNENLKVDLENAMKNRRLQYFDPKIFECTVNIRSRLNNINKTITKKNSKGHEKKTSIVSLPPSEKEDNEIEVPLTFSVENAVLHLIRRFIYSRFLVRLAISLNRYICSYKYMDKEFKKEMEEEVIKGETHIMSNVERIIENYLLNLDINNEAFNNFVLFVKREIEPQKDTNRVNLQEGEVILEEKSEIDKEKDPPAEDNIESKIKNLDEKEEELAKKNSYNTQYSKDSSNRNDTEFSNNEQNFSIGAKNEKINKELNEIFKKEKLFMNDLSTTFLLRFIMKNIFYFFLDNFHYLCYFFMILNHIMNHSLISVFWPLVVFGYALLEYPRPKNRFWRLCLFYSILVILFKFSLTLTRDPLSSFGKNETISNSTSNHTVKEYHDEYKIGISFFSDSLSIDFFNYIFWDSVLIFLIAMEQYMLITQGLWKRVEPQLETMQEAYDRVYLANSEKFKNVDSNMFLYYKSISLFKTKAEKLEAKKRRKWCVQLRKCNVLKSYYMKTFPTIRNNKPGKDFYTYYFISTLLLVCYIIIFYTYMDRNLNFQISTNQKIRQFSGGMVVVAFLHVGLIVIDRIIYIKQSRQNISHQYFYYNKDNGEKSSESDFLKKNLTEEEQSRYEKIYFQKEDLNYPMITKYIMHLVVLVLSHFLVFWYLPIIGNNNLNNINFCEKAAINQQCNDFLNNNFLIFFYILYLLYFTFSSLQIQHGLLDTKKKSVLMRGDNLFNLILFKTYKAIPFLYELKLTIDWSITPTSLDIFKWIKFESVYDLLFMTHCTMKQEKSREIGEKIGFLEKLSFGGIGFSLILLILIGPLILFSTLNPQNSNNNVTGASIKMSLCFKEKDFTNNFTLFTNENPFQLTSMDNLTMYYFNFTKSVYTKNFATEQIQKIIMYNYSDSTWSVSEPHMNLIIDRINNYSNYHFDIYLSFEFSFQRPQAGITYNSFDFELYRANRVEARIINEKQQLIESLKRNIMNCSREPILLNQLYFPAIRLNTELHPTILAGDDSLTKLDGSIMFVCSKFVKNNKTFIDYSNSYWSLNVITPIDKTKNITIADQNTGIRFYTFSDLVSSTSLSFDVMTFYISFVLLLGNLIRNFISGEAERIVITEMPEPQKILNLCEGIKISRYRHEFIREEHLYCVLIDMMRSPEILKKITKSSLQFLIEKNEDEKKIEAKKPLVLKKND